MKHRLRDVALNSFLQRNFESDGGGESSSGGGGGGGGVGGEDQVVRWERFLPRKVLRVLLVENDDSTRHIVAALLRKCSYQVSAVADGLKAWNILKERDYNFDLVLTEVVMPSVSGISLLSKIMSNEACKNIPVIMMSSHDSIGIVFKCMLKGAADFLVKPVRKNELRNLWQHVWRKHCARNCEDGLEKENSNNSKPETASDDEATSNHGSSNVRNRVIGDISEGSDSQNSCSRPEIQTGTIQKQDEPLQTNYWSTPNGTDSRFGKHEISMAEVATSSVHEEGKAQDNSTDMEIKLTLSVHKAVSTENVQNENGSYDRSPYWKNDHDSVRSKNGGGIDANLLDHNNGIHVPAEEIIGYIRTETTENCSYRVLEETDHGEYTLHESAESSDARRTACNSGSLPNWELSLRSQLKCQDKGNFQEKHVLKHSEGSAFSRYVNARGRLFHPGLSSSSSHIKANECGSSNGQLYSSDDNGRITPFPLIERATSSHIYGGEASIQCQLSSGRDKEDGSSSLLPSREDASIGRSSTGKVVSHHVQFGVAPVSIPVGTIPFQSLCANYGAILQPVFYPESSVSFRGSAEAPKDMVVNPSKPSTNNCNQLNNIPQQVNCHLYYANHHPHQLMQGMKEQRVVESTYPKATLHNPAEKTTTANGSNGTYEDTCVAVNGGVAIESGPDCDRSLREAALIKFRLKRKDRCFEKKVRYHNRQKLAEQRPRLKGQFVRQTVTETNFAVAESDD